MIVEPTQGEVIAGPLYGEEGMLVADCDLRAGLREQGLEVKEVVVTTDPDARRDRRQEAQPARPPRSRRAQGTDAPRFEVLV